MQVFALGLEKKSHAMKKQKRKQESLVLKMLPKDVVQKLNRHTHLLVEAQNMIHVFKMMICIELINIRGLNQGGA